MSELALTSPKETAKAAQAFADYVAMGPERSLRKLCTFYNKPQTYLAQLGVWSKDHNWQDRLKELAAERIDEAMEYRLGTYVAITKKYHQIIVVDEPKGAAVPLDAMNSIYDRVKPKDAIEASQAAAPSGNITVRLEIVPARNTELNS